VQIVAPRSSFVVESSVEEMTDFVDGRLLEVCPKH